MITGKWSILVRSPEQRDLIWKDPKPLLPSNIIENVCQHKIVGFFIWFLCLMVYHHYKMCLYIYIYTHTNTHTHTHTHTHAHIYIREKLKWIQQYVNKRNKGIQRVILFIIELFSNVKHFSFYIKPSLGQC